MAEGSPIYSPFFGVLGAASAMVFSAMGAAYGTAKSGTGIAAMSVMRPELIMKSIIPVVMAGIIAIYGVVVAVLIAGQVKPAHEGYSLFRWVHLPNFQQWEIYEVLLRIIFLFLCFPHCARCGKMKKNFVKSTL